MLFFVNVSILIGIFQFIYSFFALVSAAAQHNKPDIPDGIQEAYALLESIFGRVAAIVFGIALLYAGQSSTYVLQLFVM